MKTRSQTSTSGRTPSRTARKTGFLASEPVRPSTTTECRDTDVLPNEDFDANGDAWYSRGTTSILLTGERAVRGAVSGFATVVSRQYLDSKQ